MTGSSNTLLEFANLLNFLAPDEYDPWQVCIKMMANLESDASG